MKFSLLIYVEFFQIFHFIGLSSASKHLPKTNGGNFFVGAGDTNVSTATQKTIPTAFKLHLDAMTTVSVTLFVWQLQSKLHTIDVCLSAKTVNAYYIATTNVLYDIIRTSAPNITREHHSGHHTH